jgi:DNA-binding transcriptional MerR regulator
MEGEMNTDWVAIIRELRESGLTLGQIAEACRDADGTPGVSTISELGTGKRTQPLYVLGQSLLALHAKQLKRMAKQAKAASEHAQASEAPRFLRDDGTESPDTRNPEDLGRVWVAVPRRRSTDKPNAASERGGC